jgi:hypothetical protein
LDDQFTYFWFVIEILAQVAKEPARVPDKCPHCRAPLYCPDCKSTPVHKPYAKQAIEQLFGKYAKRDGDSFYKLASDMRNQLLHGEEIAAIESSLGIDFAERVNKIG